MAIPVYNGANYIAEAIESVLCQTFEDLELVITDNASTDETGDICRRFALLDSRVRYFRNPTNLGAAPNYNRGLELARGEYFKWLAHDDWISPNYLELCVPLLDRNPQFVVAHGSSAEMVDRTTPFLDSTFTVPLWGTAGPVKRFASAMRMARTCHAIFGLIRREPLETTTRHRPYYTSDRNLVSEIALLGRFAYAPEAIFYNRKHARQSMAQSANLLSLNTWQDTSNQRPYSIMHLSRLKHFWEITGRHSTIASRWQLLRPNLGYMFSPSMLVHYADELCWMALPGLYSALRGAARGLYRKLRPSQVYVGPQVAAEALAPVAAPSGPVIPLPVQPVPVAVTATTSTQIQEDDHVRALHA